MATSAQSMATKAFEVGMRKERSLWADAWNRLKRNYAAVLSIFIIAFFILVAIFAPLIVRHNPVEQSSNNSLRLPAWIHSDNPAISGRPEYLFGTDAIGRDIFSELVYGTRVSLIVGIVPSIFILLIGVPIGLIAGFVGGRVDGVLMRVTVVVYDFQDILFIITIGTAFRDAWLGQALSGLLLIFVALSIISWTGIARLVRGQVLSLREKEFIEAARAIGVPTWKILLRHILPNSLSPIIVSVAFFVPGAIVAEAILTFVGTGLHPSLDPNNPFPTSWGVMLLDGYANISSGPWMLLFPVICVGAITMAFTFLGDGLQDALDPRNN